MPTDLQGACGRAVAALCCLSAAAATALVLAVLPNAAAAASEAERDAVFARLLRTPDDRALMLDYARLSVALRDYEAAVSTLERMLAQTPDDAETRYELAIAYYALGATELASYHFGLLRGTGTLAPMRAAELEAYAAQADAAERASRITGRVSAGLTSEQGTRGTTASFALTWRIDLGAAAPAVWQTDLLGSALRYSASSSGNAIGLVLRSGPMFSLDGTAYGPHLRPYAEIRRERDPLGEDRRGLAAGLQLRNTHSVQWSSFGDLRYGRVEARELGVTLTEAQLALGATWRPSRDTLLRLSGRLRDERHSTAGSRRWTGLRLDAAHEFRPDLLSAPRNWVVSAYLQSDRIDWRDGSGLTERRDSAGITVRAFVTRDVFVAVGGRNLRWHSDVPSRERRRTLGALEIGMEF